MRAAIVGVLLWLFVTPALGAGIYKCGSGPSTSYSDQPCAAGPVARVALPPAPPASAVREARDRLERQLADARARSTATGSDAASVPVECRPELPKLAAARRLAVVD